MRTETIIWSRFRWSTVSCTPTRRWACRDTNNEGFHQSFSKLHTIQKTETTDESHSVVFSHFRSFTRHRRGGSGLRSSFGRHVRRPDDAEVHGNGEDLPMDQPPYPSLGDDRLEEGGR